MAQLFANNATTTLASPAASTDTTLTLVDGSSFPSPSGSDFFLLTLASGSPESTWEIVKVTARSMNTITVVRAQEGTTAAAWAAGAKAELRLTAGTLSTWGPSGTPWSYFSADAPQASPSTLDDEFDGASLASKWTLVNWSSTSPLHTTNLVNGVLSSVMAGGGGATYRAILQPLPAGDFSVIAKIFCDHPSSYSAAGIILSTTNAAGSGNQFVWQNFNGYGWMGRNVTNFSTDGSYTNSGATVSNYYLRVRRSGTTYYFAWSIEGCVWTEITIALSITPAYFGLHLYDNTSSTMNTIFYFFRYAGASNASFGRTVQAYLL